jgi:uncharacterized protein YndB with AHSA1/START domain
VSRHPRRIEREAVYPHSPERVWRALIDPAELAAWLMPTDFAPEVGKEFSLETGDAHIGTIQAEVLEIDEPKLLRCRWSGVFGDSVVTFELFPEGDGTRLRVVHDGFADPLPSEWAGFDDGWKQKLEQDLPRVLESIN